MLREDRKKIEEKQKRKSGKSETGISRSGNAGLFFYWGRPGLRLMKNSIAFSTTGGWMR